MPRYVILHHETPPGGERATHWDFMLEMGDALWTWALEEELCAQRAIVAVRLADHRIEYLTYEGELSGNRGTVSRWDSGECEVLEATADRIVVSLSGQRSAGVVTLTRMAGTEEEAAGQRWSVSLRKS